MLLDWWVAADDRWHTPAREVTCRQRLVEGVPVVETAIRVPGGDAVQTAYAVADGGGLAVVALENRSPAPIAVALSRRDLLTSHLPATVPVQGGDAPPDALVLPIGHRSTVVVALAPGAPAPGPLPSGLPKPEQVVRGWLRQTEAGADLRLPESPAVALPTLRSRLLLEGPPAADEPVPFLVAVAELGRLGVDVEPWVGPTPCRRRGRPPGSPDAGSFGSRPLARRRGAGRRRRGLRPRRSPPRRGGRGRRASPTVRRRAGARRSRRRSHRPGLGAAPRRRRAGRRRRPLPRPVPARLERPRGRGLSAPPRRGRRWPWRCAGTDRARLCSGRSTGRVGCCAARAWIRRGRRRPAR